jgi:hypothetical protein
MVAASVDMLPAMERNICVNLRSEALDRESRLDLVHADNELTAADLAFKASARKMNLSILKLMFC